jgi:Domain of unknown function (DUF4476)
MQKIFTLALTIIISSNIFAAAEFFLRINSNGNYTVTLNNQSVSSTTNTFRFFDLYSGNYNLRVISNFNNRVVFNQNISIQDGYRTVAEIDKFNGLKIIDKLAFVQQSWYIDNIITIQNPPICGTPVPGNPRPHSPVCNIPPKPNCGNGYFNNGWNNGYGNNNNSPNNNNYPNNYPNNFPNNGGNYGYGYGGNLVDDNTLQSIIQTMKNATFEEKMIDVGKTALKDRALKTNQVHQMLELFSFEANKLEFAKFCYDKTIDKNNYYTLYNDFAFSNYSSQLDKYINSK